MAETIAFILSGLLFLCGQELGNLIHLHYVSRFNLEMDFPESTKVVYSRIQCLEPENVSKIIGYILLQDDGEREMIRLAFSPENSIKSLINKAKTHLGLIPNPIIPAPVSLPQSIPLQLSPHVFTLRAPINYWDPVVAAEQNPVHNVEFIQQGYSDSVPDEFHLQLESVNSVGSDFCYGYKETAVGPRANRRSPSLPDFPVKVCHYFSKGFCKHGSSCRYVHGHQMPELCSSSLNDILAFEDHMFLPGSLEKLELEITELLKSHRGFPVSIASLPSLYYDKYGRNLQAEGYLTESQRHGKAGYSLTKLLARLKNSIRLIDRPHGQHAVILAEDVYNDYIGDVNEHGGIVPGSRQIYLTFPAESNFSEQDVSIYFSKFGIVQDVRIPCQQKRMFGFVTFLYAETVRHVLAKGNPHFVCGSRVLVKPYREKEKTRLFDRKCLDKVQHPMYCDASHFLDAETELQSMPRVSRNPRLISKTLIEEHEQLLEYESRRLSELRLVAEPLSSHSCLGYRINELKPTSEAHAEQLEFPLAEQPSYLLDSNDENVRHVHTKYSDLESGQGVNLPDSPFAAQKSGGV